MIIVYDDCVSTTQKCIAAAERCAASCGTSGNAVRERCAVFAHDCADAGRLVEAFMLRGSAFASQACALHAVTCDALADECAKCGNETCCKEAMIAARACAVACRACVPKVA